VTNTGFQESLDSPEIHNGETQFDRDLVLLGIVSKHIEHELHVHILIEVMVQKERILHKHKSFPNIANTQNESIHCEHHSRDVRTCKYDDKQCEVLSHNLETDRSLSEVFDCSCG
jgi:hypothetical protein